jgi:hypothetical protein
MLFALGKVVALVECDGAAASPVVTGCNECLEGICVAAAVTSVEAQ